MKVAVVGGGGFGCEVATFLQDCLGEGRRCTVGILDDVEVDLSGFAGNPVYLGPLESWKPEGWRHIVAIGDAPTRWRVGRDLEDRGARFMTLIHPTAYVASSARVADGVIVAPLAYVGPRATLARHAALNVQVSVGHDVQVGQAAVISPGAKLSGNCVVGEATFIGSVATAAPSATIGRFCKVAAGVALKGNHPDGSLVAGVPPRGRVMFQVPTDT